MASGHQFHEIFPNAERSARLVLKCTDFSVGTCCSGCHEKGYYIGVYPMSCYSEGKPRPMPDLGLGVLGEVCCGRFEAVKGLTRAFWLQLYGKKQGWSDADITILAAAEPSHFFKVSGEISSRYWRASHPNVDTIRSRAPVAKRAVPTASKCPGCGTKWSGDVCDNCGHGGGI